MEAIQDTESRGGLEPIQHLEYAATLQTREEPQWVTALLDEAREEKSHQHMITLRQDITHLTDEKVLKESESAIQTKEQC
eukprot:12914126-Prorocentrum_lima.AAC.1